MTDHQKTIGDEMMQPVLKKEISDHYLGFIKKVQDFDGDVFGQFKSVTIISNIRHDYMTN